MNEEIEVLDEDFEAIDNNNSDTIISLDRLFDSNEEVIDAYEEDKKLEDIKQKKITKIQISLIIFLVVFATIVYFFGYNFVEPFIKID